MTFFSIVLPTYNSEKVIEETIYSLLNQTFKNYEIIIVDDGSTDDTINILNKYKNRIRLYANNHSGQVKLEIVE